MKRQVHLLLSGLALAFSWSAQSQSSFQNLDFESPTLPLVHIVSGGFDFVMASNAVPGWKAYLGTNQVNVVLNNNYFGGTATVGLLGPGWTNTSGGFPPRIIEGAYTVTLQAGVDFSEGPINPPLADAAIVQSSLVPVSARSLLFKARLFQSLSSRFAVSLDGHTINMLPLTNTPNFTLFGGDITAFAGLSAELRIAAIVTPTYPFSAFAFDSISFSDQIVPEPGALWLLLGGLGFIGFWRRRTIH